MTRVRANLGADFKNCCMRRGFMDGSERDYFFQRLIASSNQRLERAVKGLWLRAAGAGKQCAPAALTMRFWAAAQAHR